MCETFFSGDVPKKKKKKNWPCSVIGTLEGIHLSLILYSANTDSLSLLSCLRGFGI